MHSVTPGKLHKVLVPVDSCSLESCGKSTEVLMADGLKKSLMAH